MTANKLNKANKVTITFFNNIKVEIDKTNYSITMDKNNCYGCEPDIIDVTQECFDIFNKYISNKEKQLLKGGVIMTKILNNKTDFECTNFLYGISKIEIN